MQTALMKNSDIQPLNKHQNIVYKKKDDET